MISAFPKPKIAPNTTLVINEKLSYGANLFLYFSTQIAISIFAEQPKEPNLAGRKIYEAFAKAFANEEPDKKTAIDIVTEQTQNNIKLRTYQQKTTQKNKILVYAHGGGWARGNLETHDELCRRLCKGANITVIAVDYHLAPEHKYPSGFKDIMLFYQWLLENRVKLGVDKDAQIILAGDSAGGNLIAACNLQIIDEQLPLPAKNILIYPVLDLRIPKTTRNPYANGYFLTRDFTNTYITGYLSNIETAKTDPYISPILATDQQLMAFPETLIVSAECDILTEQAEAFIARMEKVGNDKITWHIEPKMIHIFAQFFGAFEGAANSLVQMVQFIVK